MLPPARRCRSSPPRKARRRALLQTPRPAGRRAWQGRRWAAPLMLGTLAACLRFRRPRGRGRRSALLNVGPRLAARRRLPPSRRLTPPGSFRPSSRLRFRGRARRGRGCGLTGSTHQPPQCRLRRQQPARKERNPCGLDDRTACLVRRLAPAERRSFSRLDRCRVFQCLDFRPQFLPMSGHPHRMRSRFAR